MRRACVEPEDFKDFIRKHIDLQKLSSENLDQVASGASTFNRGIASFLTATSLLGRWALSPNKSTEDVDEPTSPPSLE